MSSSLKLFRIELQDEDGVVQFVTTERLTFQEAARDAYLLASKSGVNKHKILSIAQVNHKTKHHDNYILPTLPKSFIKSAS